MQPFKFGNGSKLIHVSKGGREAITFALLYDMFGAITM